MAKKSHSLKPNETAIILNAPVNKSIVDVLRHATDKWKRIGGKSGKMIENAIGDLINAGLAEGQIIASTEMKGEEKIQRRYTCGGSFFPLLEKEWESLIPTEWYISGKKPKKDIVKKGRITSMRLTDVGLICKDKILTDETDLILEVLKYVNTTQAKPFFQFDGLRPQKTENISLTPEDKTILEAMVNENNMTIVQEDLAEVVRVSVRTIKTRLKILREKGLVHQPCGPKKGFTVTNRGKSLIKERS